ncbi:MAG: TRAP transporter substrate-binding protein [Betaproteobacteria bacterium]|jgi:TRAP-type C4-dicarboxylate transport system substrate-binding protein|nr:TRAP transporter substrate-binding protein [Betaproteobacteria bacterium]
MSKSAAEPIQIRMGGYGPPTTTHSRALKMIGDRLAAEFGDEVDIKYVWNVMDLGYKGEDVLWMVEHGILTLAYQSTSYLTSRVPELGLVDLPFLFEDLEQARSAMDGKLGEYLTERIEARIGYRMLGYLENGYRHISNRLRRVREPGDLAGMRIRMLPSEVHCRTFELLGAIPVPCDLKQALADIASGTVDAQENPLANTVTYGVHKLHRYHTLTGHFYLSRGIYANRAAVDGWPVKLRDAMRAATREAVHRQRELAVDEETIARREIEREGCELIDLSAQERDAFVRMVRPMHDEARSRFGEGVFALAR